MITTTEKKIKEHFKTVEGKCENTVRAVGQEARHRYKL